LYIAVAPLDSQFADGFDVAPIGAGGPFSLHLSTNVSGAPLASSIPPIPDIDLHSVSGDTPVPLGVLAGSDVRWVKLRVCRAASADHPLSADLVGTNAPSSSMTLFSGGGNIVAQSVSLTSAPAAPLSFASDGSLAAGVYDLAISSGSVQTAVNGAANGRWHVRSTALGSGGTFAATIHAASSGCPTCNADFNGDGDFGTDADIRDFFACLGGNCCSACGTVDFNGDGDVGTDSDIESFFRVLAGGSR
jgi:hypothetical protein